MRLGVVPVQLLASAPNLVAIARENKRPSVKGQAFLNDQPIVIGKNDLARYSDHPCTTANHNQCRGYNGKELLGQVVDKFFVITQGLVGIHVAPSVQSRLKASGNVLAAIG